MEDLWARIEALHVASFAWARACTGSPDHAEDLLQSVYEKILSGRARFDGRSSLETWLFGVVRRTASEHRRGAWLRALRLVPMAREPAGSGGGPHEDARAILRAIARLPERQRRSCTSCSTRI